MPRKTTPSASLKRAHNAVVDATDAAPQVSAAIMLDYVTQGSYELGLAADNKQRALLGLLNNLALQRYNDQFPRAAISKSWARMHGVIWWYPIGVGGEHHALCLYCRANLNTFGPGGHVIPDLLVRRMTRHTIECALRGLLSPTDFNYRPWYCPRKPYKVNSPGNRA